MKSKKLIGLVILTLILFTAGCRKKNFEDTESYKELLRHQEEVDRRLDSIKNQNYKQLNDSVNNHFKRSLDSLKRSTDSLEKELEKSIQKLKTPVK